jgi:hypothetical protein
MRQTVPATSTSILRLVIIGVTLLTSVLATLAAVPAKTVSHYNVTSRGFTIGDASTTLSSSDEGGVASVHFETRTQVKASFLWMGYHLDTIERGTLSKGELVSYSRKGKENGAVIDVEGRLEHSVFRFQVRENHTSSTIAIPRTSYDYTTMECPEARLDFSGKTETTLRILDVEKMMVVKRDYHLIRSTMYAVNGKEYPCRIIDFVDQNKAARRWIAWDGSTVIMYRQDSRGGKNPYSVQATSINK